ncbi:ATP-binding protein [Scrofimicrobium sp. R131]|uniref:Signal transduction histidine-protein kinase/phosphatase MprB n=1 Tax=Scrofimicrobium appendicitidis TaxID=3079930 RepID=A0AAU7V9T2_9ACTO
MRARTTRLIVTVVTIVALIMGIPGSVVAGMLVWNSAQSALDTRVQTLGRSIDRRLDDDLWVTQPLVAALTNPVSGEQDAFTEIRVGGEYKVISGTKRSGPLLEAKVRSSNGATVIMQISAYPVATSVARAAMFFAGGALLSILLGWYLAYRMSRRLSAPLIYLAAQAEQIGSGQVRARLKPSGIEEIDLVQEELVRTGERMAGRLAAERQRSADASHQLRTPITALSMRLEEIEMITTEDEVREEARACLDQVERLTSVVTELLDERRRNQSSTEALHILEVFNTQREEWEDQFAAAGRELVFLDEAERPILAEAGKISQVLATLIENSLRYGAGKTVVRARKAASSRGVLIEVSDEGEGIEDDMVDEIFDMGVSGHGSSGIGLALAKDLSQAMGGRLELTQTHPPVFTLSLAAIPSNFDPDLVMPQGPLLSVGRRSRRL